MGGFCDGGCQQTGIISTKGDMEIETFCSNGGSTIGGGNSTNSTTNVKNNITDPCLRSIVQSMINSNLSNTITNILSNVFGSNTKLNLTFEQSSTIVDKFGYPVPGQTTLYFDIQTNTTYLTTQIRLDQFDPMASKEYKASIIIHEIIHAYISTNPTILNGLTQHAYMLENYIDAIASSLQGFYNITDKQAQSLALGGLGGDVTNSSAFATALAKYGFNTQNGIDNYSYFAQLFQYGSLGSQCSPSTNNNTKGK